MNPQINQHVVIFFRTGIRIEGDVLVWSDQKSVIKTLDGITVIQKTLEDVMFFKMSSAKQEYKVAAEKTVRTDADIRKLADLKIELNALEREEISSKLKSHTADGMKRTHYELPNIIPVKSPIKHTGEEVARENVGIGSELQDLFSKKD